MKVCLVGSSGGHLTHLYMLKPFWKDKEHFWVTFDKEDARSLLEGEKIYPCYYPTNRSLKALIKNTKIAWNVLHKEKPDLIISCGAAVAVPVFYIGKMMGAKLVYAYRVNMKGITQSARNNPRAIESLWITECLIAEQKKQNLLSENTYNQYFDQMAMNDSRVKELGMDVRLAALNESFRILKYYYGNYKFKIYRMKTRMLYRAIVKNDFTRAFVLMDYWNYI